MANTNSDQERQIAKLSAAVAGASLEITNIEGSDSIRVVCDQETCGWDVDADGEIEQGLAPCIYSGDRKDCEGWTDADSADPTCESCTKIDNWGDNEPYGPNGPMHDRVEERRGER